MKRKIGFTLVELLVVVAIISILAGIIVPKVAGYIASAKAARALSEIKGAETALTKMLNDSGKNNFRQFFTPQPEIGTLSLQQEESFFTIALYNLLKNGKSAQLADLDPKVRKKLSDSYLDLGKDPWGNLYHFFPGPLKLEDNGVPGETFSMPFRSYRVDTEVPGSVQPQEGLSLDVDADGNVIAYSGGPVSPDTVFGYPAPPKLPFYIYSMGADMACAQAMYEVDGVGIDAYDITLPDPANAGGGDDINNWDIDQSWSTFY